MRSIYRTPTFVWYLFRWHWSQEGMMDCVACSLGTFADAKGMKSCLQCGANVTLDTAKLALFTTSQLVSARVLACHEDFLQPTVSVSVFCAFYCRIIWAAVLHLDLKIFGFGHPCITNHHNLSPHEASRFGFLYRVPHLQISVDAFLERTWHQPASVSFAPKDLHRMEQQTSVFACIGLYRLHVFLTRFSAPPKIQRFSPQLTCYKNSWFTWRPNYGGWRDAGGRALSMIWIYSHGVLA